MIDKPFHVDIVTADKPVYRGDIFSIVVPAELGYMGVLADHAPLVARLIKGKIVLRGSFGTKVFYSEGDGFIEVLKNNVNVLLNEIR